MANSEFNQNYWNVQTVNNLIWLNDIVHEGCNWQQTVEYITLREILLQFLRQK